MRQVSIKRMLKGLTMALCIMVTQEPSAVELGDTLTIHGYGHQGYVLSNDNPYLGSDVRGTWDYNSLAMVFSAKVSDDTKIWMQPFFTASGSRLDWAYVDHQFTSNFSARAGQIKFPFGLYNEIIDAHFLQQTTLPPSLYQEATEMRFESFRGLSADYQHDVGDAALMTYEAYVGQAMDFGTPGLAKYGRLLGGRVTFVTPIKGLNLMASAFDANVQNTDRASPDFGVRTNKKTAALSMDYTTDKWDVKSEYATNQFYGVDANTGYIQAGYSIGEHWKPFVRYDYITTDKAQKSDPAYYQKSTTVGVNYAVNTSVSVRLENHFNNGYALPVKSGEVAAGSGKKDWNLFAASVNYIF